MPQEGYRDAAVEVRTAETATRGDIGEAGMWSPSPSSLAGTGAVGGNGPRSGAGAGARAAAHSSDIRTQSYF